ncbi:hypothetical protein AMECASPLE_038901 [Ameca splendens]|uniref:Uncharacterized protein n=1 Tax=Ameca splendens TaxID=208324 RepID=A0ABV0Z8F4_9TELE
MLLLSFYVVSHMFLDILQVSQQAAKCIPAMVCPELTEQIRREVAASLHQRKGDFTCYFLTDLVTFTLPAGTPEADREAANAWGNSAAAAAYCLAFLSGFLSVHQNACFVYLTGMKRRVVHMLKVA